MNALDGFKKFILKGNVVDLAIAVVMGAAFGSVVSSFVKGLLTPLIAAFGGQPDFSQLYFTINGSRFLYGEFINSVISFLIISSVIYYLVVVPINRMSGKYRSADQTVARRNCPECLSEIPLQARRCAFCTAEVASIESLRKGS